jgi:hypothetical protein
MDTIFGVFEGYARTRQCKKIVRFFWRPCGAALWRVLSLDLFSPGRRALAHIPNCLLLPARSGTHRHIRRVGR